MYVTILQRWSETNVDPTRMLLLCLVRQLYGTQILSRQRPQNSHLQQVLRYIPFAARDEDEQETHDAGQGQNHVVYQMHTYSGRLWHVPADFSFPSGVNLETGWKIWIQGQPGNGTINKDGNQQ